MRNNTTANNHHYGTETSFDSSPGEGKGHKPARTPGRQGKSYIGEVVPVKPFEGGSKPVSSSQMMDPAVESIVRKQKAMPKFPIDIVPDKDGSCNKKRLFTEKNLEPLNTNGIELVKCSPEGVDLLVPDERKDLIPAIKWAITIPRFWFSVIFKVAGPPLPKDRLIYLEEVAKGSPAFPLLILEERRSHPEFLPCGELDLATLKSMLMAFMPSSSAPAYPKQPKRLFTPREINLLQRAIKHDLFYVMLCNPVLWLPLKHNQVDSLIEEFSTAGSRLHSVLAETERGDSFVETAADNAEMPDLPKDLLIEIQLVERERTLSRLDDCLLKTENVVETEAPAGGIASRIHIDEKKRKVREAKSSTVVQDAYREEKRRESRAGHPSLREKSACAPNTENDFNDARDTQDGLLSVREFKKVRYLPDAEIRSQRGDLRERENLSIWRLLEKVSFCKMEPEERLGLIEHIEEEKLMERKNFKRKKVRQRRKLLDKMSLPEEIKQRESLPRKKLSKRKISSKENKQQRKLSGTKSVSKKEKLIKETPSVPIAFVSPEPDKVKSKWSSRWNKLRLFVKKNDASKTETSLKERFSKIWKRGNKPESTVRPLNEIHTEADEPSVSNTRAQTTRADKSSAQSSPTEIEGFEELPPCLDSSDRRYDVDDSLYEEWFGTNDPRFIEYCHERNRAPTIGSSNQVPKATPFERFTNNIKNRVSNFKRKREELRKVSELEKISIEAAGYVNRRNKYWYPPETPEDDEKRVRNHAGRLKQLKAHFKMLKKDIRHSDTGDQERRKKVCFAAYTQDEMGNSSHLKRESET